MDWLTRKRLEALTVAGPAPESVQVETSMPPIQVSMGLNNLSLSIAMWAVSLGQKDGGSMAAAFLAFECRVSWGSNFGVEL